MGHFGVYGRGLDNYFEYAIMYPQSGISMERVKGLESREYRLFSSFMQ